MKSIYEKLPLVNLKAPKVESRRTRAAKTFTEETMKQDNEDAERIMNCLNLRIAARTGDKVEAKEKYMVDTMQGTSSKGAGRGGKGLRKPHYTRVYPFGNRIIFQAACCLPLKVIAANLDGEMVSGRVLYCTHSETEGGKLVYEFLGEGSELVLDVKRGDSTRAQRLFFKI